MKKLLSSLVVLSISAVNLSAQMQIKKPNGELISDGDVYTFSTANTEDSELKFSVHNTSQNQSIKAKIVCESIENTDGMQFQLCFGGNCMPFVIPGQSYPPTGYTITPLSNSGDSDYFWNQNAFSTTGLYPISLVFKFVQLDAFGNEMGNPVRVTYKYTGALGVNESALSKAGITLKNTVVKDNLQLFLSKDASVKIFDFSGKLVTNKNLVKGDNTINLSAYGIGTYILSFTNSDGVSSTAKIIKK